MRDKHISAMLDMFRQRGSEKTANTGRQRFSDTKPTTGCQKLSKIQPSLGLQIVQKYKSTTPALTSRIFCRLMLILTLLMTFSHPVFALNQIQNGTFSVNLNGWEIRNPFSANDDDSVIDTDSYLGRLRISYRIPSGGAPAGRFFAEDCYLQQKILTSTKTSAVNARFGLIHGELKTGTNDNWSITHNGLLYIDPNAADVAKFYSNELHHGVTGPANHAWPSPLATSTITLSAGTSYYVRMHFLMQSFKGNVLTVYIDDLYCNVSPANLQASETNEIIDISRGKCRLTWDPSTNPATGVAQIGAPPYRLYESPTGDEPWVQIATPTTASITVSPGADIVYYAVSDVDTLTVESPKSLVAVYRTAKLEITKVENTTKKVTKGQDGLPVLVYITNTGNTPATLETIALTFDSPQYGNYAISAPSPSLGAGITFAPGEPKIFTFMLSVGVDSVTGNDFIGADITGKNALTGGALSDSAAQNEKADWLIQSPPNLVLLDITASPTVYLDQTGASVYLTVRNDGEAAAVWDLWNNTELHFTLGSYSLPRPYGVANPYSEIIQTGETKTVRYEIDILPGSATGTSSINASMTYLDGNTYNIFKNDTGDSTPPSWTIRSGILKTFRGEPQFFPQMESSSFNLGNFVVYAEASNLQPDRDLMLRWYPPNPPAVQRNDMRATDLDGILLGSYALSTDTALLGKWRIIVSRITNEIPLCETYFDVVDPASLTVQMILPNFVTQLQPFNVTMRLHNAGGSRIDTAYASALTTSGSGVATGSLINNQLVTVPPYGYTDIYWPMTATSIGSYTVSGRGYGIDSNDLRNLTSQIATSNMCIIQAPPIATITSLTAVETQVSRNQQNLIVTMGVNNTGSASARIISADLNFTKTPHFTVLESPALPYLLAANSPATITFRVAVGPDCATGTATITGTFFAEDANWASKTYTVSSPPWSDTWTIAAPRGYCSYINTFPPEQYSFNLNQMVYTKFTNLPPNYYRIFILPANINPPPDGNTDPVPGSLNVGVEGIGNANYPPGSLGLWKAEIWVCKSSNGKREGTTYVARQFFEVQNPGSLTTSLAFTPTEVIVGENVSLVMTVSNNVASGSTIENIVPSLPVMFTGSLGVLASPTGPIPASATLLAGSTATFTWTYTATANSATGTYRVTSTAAGDDANTHQPATPSTSLSDGLRIVYRDLSYATSPLDFGTMVCGEIKNVGTGTVKNIGSTTLNRVTWYKGFYINDTLDSFHPTNVTIYPLSGFAVPVAAPAATSSYAILKMPYNQPAGEYVATMTVFEDLLPYNGVFDSGEPSYVFNSRVIASQCSVIYTVPDLVNMGDWRQGNTISTQTITIRNGGNLNLSNLKFRQVQATDFDLFVTPLNILSLATNAVSIASISGYVSPTAADGDYVLDFEVWEDLGGGNEGAIATFQVQIGIGEQSMLLTDAFINFGNATPTGPLLQASFMINNNGDKPLTKLRYTVANLFHNDQVNFPGVSIPYDEIKLDLPESIVVGATETAYIYMYIPAGTDVGTYTSDIIGPVVTIFEDEDGSGTVTNNNEAPTTLGLKVYVNPYRGLRVYKTSITAGALSIYEEGTDTLTMKNTGNMALHNMLWEEVELANEAGNKIATVAYWFEPDEAGPPGFGFDLFTKQFLTATMTLSVPEGTAEGIFTGSSAWLFDDLDLNGRFLGNDPQAPFSVSVQVGTKYIDILATNVAILNAAPSYLSDAGPFTIKNTGTLGLNRPMATATALYFGAYSIPATASIFPNVSEYMVASKTLDWVWQVQVPPGTEAGTYIGTMTVWNDTKPGGIDAGEASDTARLELQVISKTVIGVDPLVLNFGYVAPERTATMSFRVLNLGNEDIPVGNLLRHVASWLPPLIDGTGIPIPSSKLAFSPDPFAASLPKNSSIDATAAITIPAVQAKVTYQGVQRVYVDVAPPGYDAGEVTATFSVRVSVGNKQITVADVNMGSHAHATAATTNFTLLNAGDINMNNIKWLAKGISNGAATLTPLLTSAGGSVVAGGTLNCSVNVIIPQYFLPGIYTGIQTVYDDDLAPIGVQDNDREASDTFLLTLTVEENPGLSITNVDPAFPVNLALGQKVFVSVTCQNTGNVTLSDLTWGSPMATMNGSEGNTMVPTFSPIPLPALAPGAAYTASITFEARTDQATGTYTGVQTLSSTAYPAATVNIAPNVLVVAQTGPKDLEKGTVFQNIATATFAAGGDFIFSVYVGFEDGLPASGTIGFRQDKADDNPAVPMSFVTIDQSGNVVNANPAGAGGVASSIKSGNKTWYRLHLKFPGALSPLTESTYLILSNSSSSTIPKVWFDGVQLERANGRNRPTSFGEGSKIISPSNRIDLEGKSSYSDW